jgi:hypothetical protein
MYIRRFFAVLLPLLVIGCGSDTPSSPSSSSSTSATPAPASVSETYSGTLAIGGAKFYSFTVSAYGTVNVTLGVLDGPDIAPETTVDLGLGVPSGLGCSANVTMTVSTQTAAPQITGSYQPGIYCVRVADTTAILPEPAAFSIAIEHS